MVKREEITKVKRWHLVIILFWMRKTNKWEVKKKDKKKYTYSIFIWFPAGNSSWGSDFSRFWSKYLRKKKEKILILLNVDNYYFKNFFKNVYCWNIN